ncbi:LEM domain-containing protein 1 [Chanos chanos]|uniref:LEM domain-containing protein 1 n=1 Tax=Chanos chanos TaxID=29144 RepID=A0A6J2UV18_CHACN|nr:lamina-associated polypeptide 2, isoforms beta/delta/epsilon/gamma-like [Chanos chanos]
MPVFVEDPSQFSKQRLKAELITHNVELPARESKKEVLLELYLKHVGVKPTADFSSDEEEDQVQNGNDEGDKPDPDMTDLSLLTDEQLKVKLLKYGVKAGPIVDSTRSLYEKKLQRLMEPAPEVKLNGTGDAGQYSDSEEEQDEEEEDEQEAPEQSDPETVTELDSAANQLKRSPGSGECSYADSSTCSTFSITQLVEQGSLLVAVVTASKCPLTVIGFTLEPANDLLKEMFPDAEVTPFGISATRRRPIRGAAGRPVQFKYPLPDFSPASVERKEISRRLVPLWIQTVIFLIVSSLLFLIYMTFEEFSY